MVDGFGWELSTKRRRYSGWPHRHPATVGQCVALIISFEEMLQSVDFPVLCPVQRSLSKNSQGIGASTVV
jgi:hypothetical protein